MSEGENEAWAEMLLNLGDKAKSIYKIVVASGLDHYESDRDERMISLGDLIAQGQLSTKEQDDLFECMVEQSRPEHVALLLSSSGMSAQPKLVMVQHKALPYKPLGLPTM